MFSHLVHIHRKVGLFCWVLHLHRTVGGFKHDFKVEVRLGFRLRSRGC